ncbi:MAG TPA: HPr(Ser) kinase/phosphatase [Opitutales bacterium]|jgi:HPr kinase/phosphorylase|nr:HPr(Ser) kinase/phosphatase [Opitutales bacterium]
MNARDTHQIIQSLSVREFMDSFKKDLEMELVAGEKGLANVIGEKSINRPALALTGYFKYFANKRIQLFGAGEMGYLHDLSAKAQEKIVGQILAKKIPCIVVSRNLTPTRVLIKAADAANVPLIRTPLDTKDFTAQATVLLEEKFAPRIAVHGTLVDIKGVGTLLRGKSGVGKSECALALVERGHSLVADDITYVRLVGERELIGRSAELNRGYMECRGLGIINIAELFGVRSVRVEKRIDLVVTFVDYTTGMDEERTGLEQLYHAILGREIPLIQIPVRPGRDLARLVEVAALVQALKAIGHDSAKEFNERLIAHMAGATGQPPQAQSD